MDFVNEMNEIGPDPPKNSSPTAPPAGLPATPPDGSQPHLSPLTSKTCNICKFLKWFVLDHTAHIETSIFPHIHT